MYFLYPLRCHKCIHKDWISTIVSSSTSIEVYNFHVHLAYKQIKSIRVYINMILLFPMPVKIDHVLYLLAFGKICDQLLDFCNFWRELLGWATRTLIVSSPHCRLRSSPAILHLDMPCITPSGFTIGTTTNSYFWRRYLICLLF